ncbi:MAG: dTMP kinase [Gammaproteobacteria bacterium]|nr:dTMP kinase [Gammaproteobacteria bacterium]
MRGRLITLEGGEGAGKSTQLSFMSDYLQQHKIPVVTTREPGGTLIGEKIREILLSNSNKIVDDAELLLMFAARSQHVQEVIQPALELGNWVICDRFTDASYAYQSGGRGVSSLRIQQLEQWVLQGLKPDLTVLLDISVDVGHQRIADRSKDRFEQESHEFFEAVRRVYLDRANREPERIKVIDAGQSPDVVNKCIQAYLDEFITSA